MEVVIHYMNNKTVPAANVSRLWRALFSVLIISLTIMAPIGVTRSQQPATGNASPAPSPVGTPAAPSAPTPIPLPEVVTQAETTSATLTNIKGDLTADQVIPVIAGQLPVLAQQIDEGLNENEKLLNSSPSLDTLRRLESQWISLVQKVLGWKSDLSARGALLDREITRLNQLDQAWSMTLAQDQSAQTSPETRQQGGSNATAIEQPATPPEILQRMQSVLTSIKQTREEVEQSRAQLLKLQNRIAEEDSRIADALASVKQVREQAISRLFVRDSPVIWSREVWSGTGQHLWQESRSSFIAQWRNLVMYARREWGRLVLHLVILVLFVVALYWARRRVRPWVVAEPSLEGVSRVFNIPIATALILSIMMSGWIYPQAPRMLSAILGAGALVPTVITLRQLIDRHLYPILNALVVFYFVDQVRAISASVPVLSRLLFLTEAFGGIIYLTWLIKSVKVASVPETERSRLWKTIWHGAHIAVLVFSAAFIANALGYVSIAGLVGNALLESTYLAVILYAAVRIADGLIMFLTRIRPISQLGMVRHYRPLLRRRIQRGLRWIAVLLWALYTLEQLSIRTSIIDYLRAALNAQLQVGSLSISLGNVLAFLLTVWLAFLLSRFVRFIMEEDIYPRANLARGLPYAISTMLHYVILLIGFFFAVAAMGIDMTKFTILAGAFGVGLGFGLQNIVNNFVSGIILLFERPVNVGDMIQVGNRDGELRRIGMRASVIRTLEGSEVIVPNGHLISEEVLNWTLSDQQRRLEVSVGVAYGTDPERVIEILTSVAATHPDVMQDPPPQTLFIGFGDSALNFQLRAWTNHFDRWVRIRSELMVGVNAALRDAAIQIPFPQLDLHVQKNEADTNAPRSSGVSTLSEESEDKSSITTEG